MSFGRLLRTVSAAWFLGVVFNSGLAHGQGSSNSSTARAHDDAAAVARLSLDVTRTQDIRAVKRLQITYAQYSQFGLWSQMASLFSDKAEAIYDEDHVQGRAEISKYFLTKWGNGREGLPAGGLHTQFDDVPVINLSADGRTAKGRWYEFTMRGKYGGGAFWDEGIMENDYVKEFGVWKIARLHYHQNFTGPYETGWRNGTVLPIFPYHFTPESAGMPIPPVPAGMKIPALIGSPAAALASVDVRIRMMNDTDLVTNLQNAYSYYIDSKMWDDAADLFTDDGVLEDGDVGIYRGSVSIRRGYHRNGPVGLKFGQAFDHPIFDLIVTVSRDGMEAHSRGVEFREIGEVTTGTASFGVAVFSNRFVKGSDGKWRIREMRIFPVMATDYYQGWGKSRLMPTPVTGEFAPDAPLPAGDGGTLTNGAIPIFLDNNPVTGKPVALPPGAKVVAAGRLLPAGAPAPAEPAVSLAEAERRLMVSRAFDGLENISHAFSNYLDDFQWREHSQLYAPDGWRGKYFLAFYEGPRHIYLDDILEFGDPPNPRTGVAMHWLTQPVITAAADGKEAISRYYLFHLSTSSQRAGVFANGVYPSNEAVLLNGVWKFELVADDEAYFDSSSYQDGWAHYKSGACSMTSCPPVVPGQINRDTKVPVRMQKVIDFLPPDHPESAMPLRYHSWLPGDVFTWPNIKPMWFHYKNPVSDRVPANYCPNMKTCEKDLEASGYKALPPPPE